MKNTWPYKAKLWRKIAHWIGLKIPLGFVTFEIFIRMQNLGCCLCKLWNHHDKPVYLKSPPRQYKGERELWGRNTCPVENHVPCGAWEPFVFPKEMVLSCHTLDTHGLVKQGEAHIENKETFKNLQQRMIKNRWIWGHLRIRGPWLCNTQTETHLNPV